MVQYREPVLQVVFYRTESGREPVREWLRSLDPDAKKILGEDVKTVQFGWPLGMPLVRPMGGGLFEIRSPLRNTVARILFATREGTMVLLHGFIKKSQKTPQKELELARRRSMDLK